MRASTVLFVAATVISAGFAIMAAARDDRAGSYLFKPLTTFIVLLGAAWLVQPGAQPYRALIVCGLAFSLAGDILLVLPSPRFAFGLAAFLFAHLAYIVAFSAGNPIAPAQLPWLLPFLAVCGAATAYVWPGLGSLRAPVLLYLAALSTMAWRAATRGHAPLVTRPGYLLALGGACLFVASDVILAVRRFRHASRAAHTAELGLYWAAQLLIALSVRG